MRRDAAASGAVCAAGVPAVVVRQLVTQNEGELLVEKEYISQPELDFFLNLQIVRNANAHVADANRRREFLLGEIMLASRLITNAQLKEALAYQDKKGGWLGQALLNMGYISESALKQCLDTQYSIRKKAEMNDERVATS